MANLARGFLVVLAYSLCVGCSGPRTRSLDLTDAGSGFWSFYSAEPAAMQDVWRFEDGILICTGSPLGYLYSNEDCDRFILTLDWRWPPDGQPGKGGVLIYMTGGHTIWPKSLEAQINAGGAGDFWALNGYDLAAPADRMRIVDHEKFGRLVNIPRTADLEKPAGQWNHYRIVADTDAVTLYLNGQQVNQATRFAPARGRICLTSEGSEIHFRNVTLLPIKP